MIVLKTSIVRFKTPLKLPGFKAFLPGLLCLYLLAGCSSEFLYNRVDRLAQFYIERYIDLDRDQSNILRVSLENLREWHRQDELSEYREFLNQIETDIQDDITRETVAGWMSKARTAYFRIRDKAIPSLIEVAVTLTPTQVEEFSVKLEKRNRELEKEYLSRDEAEYHESIFEEMDDGLNYWLGKLTDNQKQRLEETAGGIERLDARWLTGRRSWQSRIITELERKPGWQDRLRALIMSRTVYTDRDDIDASNRNEQRIYAAVADVMNMRTEKQQQKLLKKLREWEGNLASLQDTEKRPRKNKEG
jgi:hypothetical protein